MYAPIQQLSSDPQGFERLTSQRLCEAFHGERLELEASQNRFEPVGKITSRRLSSIEMLRSKAATSNRPFEIHRDSKSSRGGQDELFLVVVLASQLSCEIGNSYYALAEGDIALIGSEHPTRMEFSAGFDGLWVRLPKIESHIRRVIFQDAVDRKFDSRHGIMHVLLRTLLATYESANSIAGDSVPWLESSLLDLIAAAVSASSIVAREGHATTYSRATLQRIKSYIVARLHDDTLTPSSIASAMGISVRRLNELFAQCQTTVTEWIIAERLERCRNRLLFRNQVRETICQVAYEEGFKNISHFNRAFKNRFGESPGQLRDRIRCESLPSVDPERGVQLEVM
ncbi:AraC-like DNA-binding protein [Paraburkholderia sp. BL6665CI2N2]|uniref:helix-turn-helix domain-containing protein n=1 Tax=Paraburkholderia sp. BL6665CI2N2 TaxID=1938806 RepID=UPI0010648B9F|nr:helix-turn-helix domain-containing protein [Paraburkholderia sp. BL6665CI2N2]TDY19982.1 AraC-like DNA-binding protein [Paraburkholderia sp. BL6665CI2N2]